jgi:hypothetical protein
VASTLSYQKVQFSHCPDRRARHMTNTSSFSNVLALKEKSSGFYDWKVALFGERHENETAAFYQREDF